MRGLFLALACALALAATGCASLGRRPDFDEETLRAARLLDSSAAEVALRLGEPRRMLNIEGMGFYGYEEYGFYFDDIVLFYENGKKVRIADSAAGVLLIDLLDEDGVMGIRKGRSRVEDLASKLGRPDSIRLISGGGEVLNPFAGTYYLYRLGSDHFAVRIEDGAAAALLLVGERNLFFK